MDGTVNHWKNTGNCTVILSAMPSSAVIGPSAIISANTYKNMSALVEYRHQLPFLIMLLMGYRSDWRIFAIKRVPAVPLKFKPLNWNYLHWCSASHQWLCIEVLKWWDGYLLNRCIPIVTATIKHIIQISQDCYNWFSNYFCLSYTISTCINWVRASMQVLVARVCILCLFKG